MTSRSSRAVPCPYCGEWADFLASSEEVYGTDWGSLWHCPCEPAWVGCHKGTDRPLGRLANAELRAAKMAAHDAFDPLWQSGEMTRRGAYAWLAEQLGIETRKCHIGWFDEETCAWVVRVCEEAGRDSGAA